VVVWNVVGGMKYNKTTGELEKKGIPTGWVDNSRGCNVY
jgi:hypothetical protein